MPIGSIPSAIVMDVCGVILPIGDWILMVILFALFNCVVVAGTVVICVDAIVQFSAYIWDLICKEENEGGGLA